MGAAVLLPDDRVFLLRRLPTNDTPARSRLISGYREQWFAGMDAELVEYRKQNAGRSRANTWLRMATKSQKR